MELLLKLGADPEMDVSKDESAIEYTIRNDDGEVFDCLIEAGVRVNQENSKYIKHLQIASEHGQADVVKRWLQAGVDVNSQHKDVSSQVK